MSTLDMSALVDKESGELIKVSKLWVGGAVKAHQSIYAHFIENSLVVDRWYIYEHDHDARLVAYEDLPEAVRMAYLLIT